MPTNPPNNRQPPTSVVGFFRLQPSTFDLITYIKMRLSDFERESIVETIITYDPDAEVYLYGSRCDDKKRGGDIDLAILSTKIDRKETGHIRLRLYDLIGEQKIDIITAGSAETPFLKKAIHTGIKLNGK